MAAKKDVKTPAKGGAPTKAKKKGMWALYTISGDKVSRKNPYSPKAGKGFFMAVHKDRSTCGATGYTEFKKKQ